MRQVSASRTPEISRGSRRRSVLRAAFGVAAGCLVALPLHAAVITVTSTADVLADDGLCTLREAILAANLNIPFGNCPAGEATDPITDLPVDQIVFVNLRGSPDIYVLARPGANEDFALLGDLDIRESVSLVGNGAQETIIDGNELDRVFHVIVSLLEIDAVIDGVTIRGGSATRGGGVYNFVGYLTISNSLVTSNKTKCSGATGCPGDTLPPTDTVSLGGGIFTQGGSLSLFQTAVIENEVTCANLIGCVARGGGVYISGDVAATTVTVVNSLIASNTVLCLGCNAGGGGIYSDDQFGTMSIETSSVVFANVARCTGVNCVSEGGGVRIRGGTAQIVGVSEIRDSVVECDGVGGVDCVVRGGGVYIGPFASLLVQDSTISGNAATCRVRNPERPCLFSLAAGEGGGIFNAGTLEIRRSTRSGNVARGRTASFGGGLANVALATVAVVPTAEVINSTFSGNVATCAVFPCSSQGGGLWTSFALTRMSHSTVFANVAHCPGASCGGGLVIPIFADGVASAVTNLVVANNAPGGDCLLPVFDPGANLDSDGTCGFSLTSPSPGLLPLANNGGQTRTHAVGLFSPAIDAAVCNDLDGNPVATDQRSVARPQGANCDLGAYESSPDELVQDLLDLLTFFDLKLSMMAQFRRTLDLLADGILANDAAVCGQLGAFLNQLRVLERRGELSRGQAATLHHATETLGRNMGCARLAGAGLGPDPRLRITTLGVPESVGAGDPFEVSVAARDPVGIQQLELRFAGRTHVMPTGGEMAVVEIFSLRDPPAGHFELQAVAVGVDGVVGDPESALVAVGEYRSDAPVESPEEFERRLAEWTASGRDRFELYERGPLYQRGPATRSLQRRAEAVRRLDATRDQLDLGKKLLQNVPQGLLNWWLFWNQGGSPQPFDWKTHCGPNTPGVTLDGEVLECWLALHPQIRFSMFWQEVDANGNVDGMTYNEWPSFLKNFLNVNFFHYYQWLSGNLAQFPGIEVLSPPFNQVQLQDGQSAVTAFSGFAARSLYVQNVAHSLALEIGGFVPWSILNYDPTDLFRILSSLFLFSAGHYLDASSTEFNGWWPRGSPFSVTPAPPTVTFQFLVDENILRPTHYDTIARLMKWGRDHMAHYGGQPVAENMENHWQYRGNAPTARMISLTKMLSPMSPAHAWTPGCSGASRFFVDVLRAANIPVSVQHPAAGGGHTMPVFHSAGVALSHGDDVYSVQFNIPSVDPDYLPPGDVLISTQTFSQWFLGPEAGSHNVGRQVIEIANDILPNKLMQKNCDDLAAFKSHAQSSVYAEFDKVYTVQEMEAAGLWTRLAAKEAVHDFCPDLLFILPPP